MSTDLFTRGGNPDFNICPHCWAVNPPSRLCARCLADMTSVLQESGGARWAAAVQSPVPVRRRLSRGMRAALLALVLLLGLAHLSLALAPQPQVRNGGGVLPSAPPLPASR